MQPTVGVCSEATVQAESGTPWRFSTTIKLPSTPNAHWVGRKFARPGGGGG